MSKYYLLTSYPSRHGVSAHININGLFSGTENGKLQFGGLEWLQWEERSAGVDAGG